jgi:uncharacterized membrane protein
MTVVSLVQDPVNEAWLTLVILRRQGASGSIPAFRDCDTLPLQIPELTGAALADSAPAHSAAEPMFVIRPNCSLTWRGNLWLLAGLCTVSFGIAGAFAWLGLWLVLPFAGLEMGVLALALYLCAWRAQRIEVVRLDGDCVRIEVGHRQPEFRQKFDRHWVRVLLLPADTGHHRSRLLLRSHGRQLEIGACLPEEERRQLATALREALAVTGGRDEHPVVPTSGRS